MIVYRQHNEAEGDGVAFFATKQEAKEAFDRSEKDGIPTRVEKLDLPTDKEGLLWALNTLMLHPDHWPGVPVYRPKRAT